MKYSLVGLCVIGIFSIGASSGSATIRPNIGLSQVSRSSKNNEDLYWAAAPLPAFSTNRALRRRAFRRLPSEAQETPLKSKYENVVKRLKNSVTTYRDRHFTTPSFNNNFRHIPHFPGPRNEPQASPAPPSGRVANPRITDSSETKSRSLPQISNLSPEMQNLGLPQTLTQFNDQRNFATRNLFRQPLAENSLVGLVPLAAPPIAPYNIHSFLTRPLEEDFEDYELFSYHDFPQFRRPFLSHRPHPVITDRLASIDYAMPSPIRLYQSLQVKGGSNALPAIKNPLIIDARGSIRRILDPGGLQMTRDDRSDVREQTPFFQEQLDTARNIHVNPDRPPSRFSVELIDGSNKRANQKQTVKRFRVPSYVNGIPPHNHPLLDGFVMNQFLNS